MTNISGNNTGSRNGQVLRFSGGDKKIDPFQVLPGGADNSSHPLPNPPVVNEKPLVSRYINKDLGIQNFENTCYSLLAGILEKDPELEKEKNRKQLEKMLKEELKKLAFYSTAAINTIVNHYLRYRIS